MITLARIITAALLLGYNLTAGAATMNISAVFSPSMTNPANIAPDNCLVHPNSIYLSYPQLGGKLNYEQYYGKKVALFGKNNRQHKPRTVTAGLNYLTGGAHLPARRYVLDSTDS